MKTWLLFEITHRLLNSVLVTANVHQPWTNYVSNGNEYLIIGATVCPEYSNISYLHLIFGNAQKFASGDKNSF